MSEVQAILDDHTQVRVMRLVTASGIELWPISADEARLLRDYRSVKAEGRGSLYVELAEYRCSRYDVKLGGGVQVMNQLLHGAGDGTVSTKMRD